MGLAHKMLRSNGKTQSLSKKVKRELTKKQICKGLEIGSITAELAANVAGDVNSIPVIGEVTGIFTAGTAIASHTAKAGIDITRAVMECDDINFDEIKEIMDKKFSEMERKLDQITSALNMVSELVGKTLYTVERTRQEMKEGFKRVIDSIENSKIEKVVLKIKNFVEYFESEKERIQSLEKDDYVSDLKESELLDYLKKSRTPTGDSLQTAIFEILEQNYAIPDDREDKIAFTALYALLYGTQAYVEVMYFLIEKYAYLANDSYERYNLKSFNDYFNLIKTTFNGFKFTFIGTASKKGLIDKVIKTFDTVFKSNFDKNTNEDISQRIDSLNVMKTNIKNMILPIIEQVPENTIEISFTLSQVYVPIGDWKTGTKVKYALQYVQDGKYSKVSDWTESFTVQEKASPFLKLSVDPNRRTRLVFRRLNSEKPKLVGVVDPYTTEFRDINRDLYDAAGSVNEQSVQDDMAELIRNGADIETDFEKGRKAIHAAAQHGNAVLTLRFILGANDPNVNVTDSYGYSPLHLAADAGRDDFVQLLVDAGSDINAKTVSLQLTPLHMVTRKGYEKTVSKLLFHRKLNVNEKNVDGFTPLHTAVIGGYKVVEALFARPEIDMNAKSNAGLTPFHLAVMKNDKVVVESLLKSTKVEVNAGDKNNMTALHFACMVGYSNMVRLLVNTKGIDVNVKAIENKWSPLYYAIFFKHNDAAIELLKAKDVDVNLLTDGNVTPLHLAIVKGLTIIALDLLSKDAIVDKTTDDGLTPLHAAAFRGMSDVIQILHKKGSNIDAKTKEGLTSLHVAATSGHLEAVKSLLELGADVRIRDSEGNSFFYLAVQNGHTNIVKYSVENNKIDINSNDNWRPQQGKGLQKVAYWAVCDALNFGKIEVVKYLVGQLKNYVCSPVQSAAGAGYLDIVKYLVEEVQMDANGEPGVLPPILSAADSNRLNIVKYLVEKGVDVNSDFRGMFLITLVVIRRQLRMLEYIVEQGAKVDVKTQSGGTLLHEAVTNGKNVLKFLVEQNKININAQDTDGNTALHVAANYNDLEAINFLCSKGADVTIKNSIGETAYDTIQKQGVKPKCLTPKSYLLLKRNVDSILKTDELNSEGANLLSNNDIDNFPMKTFQAENKLNSGLKFNMNDDIKSSFKAIPNHSDGSNIYEPHAIKNMDINGTMLLVDLLLRKITDNKLNFKKDNVMTLLEARAGALNIVEIFDSLMETADEDIDLFDLYSAVRKALMRGNRDKLLNILHDNMQKIPKFKSELFFSILGEKLLNDNV